MNAYLKFYICKSRKPEAPDLSRSIYEDLCDHLPHRLAKTDEGYINYCTRGLEQYRAQLSHYETGGLSSNKVAIASDADITAAESREDFIRWVS